MIYISSQPFLWLLFDRKLPAVLVILSGDAGMDGKDLVLYRNAQSGDFLLPCCLCSWGAWDFSTPLRCGQNDGAESFVFPPPIFSASGIFFISPLISTGWGFFDGVGDGCWREWENFRACLGWSILYFISKYRVFLSLFIFSFPIPNKLFSL